MFDKCFDGYDDVDEEMDVRKANFLVSEANIFVGECLGALKF